MTTTTSTTGADVVADVLQQLGVRYAFGLPGIHMLSLWEALRAGDVRTVPLRTELDAGYAADGAARIAGEPVALLLSSGPGALNALAALMEAAAVHSPVIAIVGQVDREFIGAGRGVLHELRDQIASFRPIVKRAWSVRDPAEIGPTIQAAWDAARTAPGGPVFVEVPADVLAGDAVPWTLQEALAPEPAAYDREQVEAAASALARADRPVVWAGTGVIRAGAADPLRELAERLDAPIVPTPSARDVVSHDHPLSCGAAAHEAATLRLLADADVVLAVGSRLGADATGDFGLRLSGTLIQIDVDADRIGRTFPALPVVGAGAAGLPRRPAPHPAPPPRAGAARPPRGRAARAARGAGPAGRARPPARLPARPARDGAARARGVREAVAARVASEEIGPEPGLVRALRAVLPVDAVDAWDSTILGYWGAGYFPARRPGRFLYPSGSGTIGFAFPAALGAAAVRPDLPVLAVTGDGGFQYGIAELAAARQHGLNVKLVLVDDGGYGILREYQEARFGTRTATDLTEPDFVAVCDAFGVPARRATLESFPLDVAWLLAEAGPAVVVLKTELRCYAFDEGGDQ